MERKRRKPIIAVNFQQKEVYISFRLIEMHGRKWKTIADEMDRTPINVRDKYKSLGEENYGIREKDNWTIEELLKLIRLVEKRVKTQLLPPDITEERILKSIDKNNNSQIYIDATRKKNRSFAFDKKLVRLEKKNFP